MGFTEVLKKCEDCGYKSTRAFNIHRHKTRIHDPSKRELVCCDESFVSKCDLYCHVEEQHPHTRRGFISKKIYKITKTNIIKKKISCKKQMSEDDIIFLFDQNISWPTGKEVAEYLRNIKFHKLYEYFEF